MSENQVKEIDRNASHSAFGWDFQVGAGIILMLENIKELSKLKIEGKNDDIELTLSNAKIFAQAKSVMQIGDQRNAKRNLNGAFSTFKDDIKKNKTPIISFVYITNISNPLSSEYKSAFEYGNTYDFSILSDKDQQKIIEGLGDDFPVDKFKIKIIRFFGEGDNKWSDVKKQIAEFLRCSIDDVSYDKRLLENWLYEFITNAADKPIPEREITIDKKDLILPIIILVTENAVSESNFLKVCDYDDFDGLKKKYRKVLSQKKCDYEFVTKVIGDYLQHNKGTLKCSKIDYVTSNWEKYTVDFAFIDDEEEAEALIKLSILSVLLRKSQIERIRKEANL